MWKCEYNDHAGYDMMSGAYKIISPAGVTVCVVDVASHHIDPLDNWISKEQAQAKAKEYAELIVGALNGDNIEEACLECEERND